METCVFEAAAYEKYHHIAIAGGKDSCRVEGDLVWEGWWQAPQKLFVYSQDTFDHDKGQNLQFPGIVRTGFFFLNFLQ